MTKNPILVTCIALALLLRITSVKVLQAQARRVSGVVETIDGKRLPRTTIRITHVAGQVTSESGEFGITIPSKVEPGDPIELWLAGDWIIISPWEGRTFAPRLSTSSIHVRVAKKGDERILSDSASVRELVRNSPGSSDEDLYLAHKATELGFTLGQVKTAIDTWIQTVESPYDKGLAALYANKYADASRFLQESISNSEADLVPKYVALSDAEQNLGHYTIARSALEKARALQPNSSIVTERLGFVSMQEGNYAQAEDLMKRAAALDEQRIGESSVEVGGDLYALGALYYVLGRFVDSDKYLNHALSLEQGLVDEHKMVPADPNLTKIWNLLGETYRREGRYSAGEELVRKALSADESALGKEHLVVAQDLINLALTLAEQGNFTEAEVSLTRAIGIETQILGSAHPDIARDDLNLASIYENEGKFDQAEPLLLQALKIDSEALGPTHQDLAGIYSNLGNAHDGQKRFLDSEQDYQRALAIAVQSLGPRNFRVAIVQRGLAATYIDEGKPEAAEQLLVQAFQIDADALGKANLYVVMDLNLLAYVYGITGRNELAEAKYREALELNNLENSDPNYPALFTSANDLALLLDKLGRHDEAVSFHEIALKAQAKLKEVKEKTH